MKARIAFYFAAVVALVLFLAAAIPSHATQHRDPALTPDNMQKAAQSTKPITASPTSDQNTAKARSKSAKARKQPSGPQGSRSRAGR